MSVKKLSYYLWDVDVMLKIDHLPLKKSLQKNTLNSRVSTGQLKYHPMRTNLNVLRELKTV